MCFFSIVFYIVCIISIILTNLITIFNEKKRYEHKAGFMRHKPPQELVQEAYAEGLCGWLMRGLVRSAYAEYKALCGPLMRTTAKFQN